MHEKCGLFERLIKIEEDFPGANVILHKVPNMPMVGISPTLVIVETEMTLRRINMLSGKATVSVSFLPSSSVGVNSWRKEFARRSNFFPLRVSPFLKGYAFQRNKQEVTKIVPCVKLAGKYGDTPIYPKQYDGRTNAPEEAI